MITIKRIHSRFLPALFLCLTCAVPFVQAQEATTHAVEQDVQSAAVSSSVEHDVEPAAVASGPGHEVEASAKTEEPQPINHVEGEKAKASADPALLTTGPVSEPSHGHNDTSTTTTSSDVSHKTEKPNAVPADVQAEGDQAKAMERLYERLEKKVQEVERERAKTRGEKTDDAEKDKDHAQGMNKHDEEECPPSSKKKSKKKSKKPEIEWSYSGPGAPEHWGKLKPDYVLCQTGKSQSPIDLRSSYTVHLDPLVFDYQHADISVHDSGHDIGFHVSPGSFLIINGQEYQLIGGHFHIPGEHFLSGRQPDVSLHLVHKDMSGHFAVVEVPFVVDRASDYGKYHNPAIGSLLAHMPLSKTDEVWVSSDRFNIGELLPPVKQRSQYYAYIGSLTTPPCTEGVQWFVMKNPLRISRQQYQLLSQLYSGTARPLQALNGRLVKNGL